MKDPSSKLTRMRLDLEEFDYTVEYLRGKNHFVADALSRITTAELKEINLNKWTGIRIRSKIKVN